MKASTAAMSRSGITIMGLVAGWGDPDAMILPRSSCKMVQALPLVESGAAARAGLGPEQLALACASHNGAAIHTVRVREWLKTLGLAEPDLRCGPQFPNDPRGADRSHPRWALRMTNATTIAPANTRAF